MSESRALVALFGALREVEDLEAASPTKTGGSPVKPAVTRAVGRAGIVLLTSHFERYFYAVNEEAVSYLSVNVIDGTTLPDEIRLVHTKIPIDELAITGWERRKEKLAEFILSDGWLWSNQLKGDLDANRTLAWMKSAKPKSLIRYYRYWGIEDIFSIITRTTRGKSRFHLSIGSLVDKRNNIAHGDAAEQATPRDVRGYSKDVKEFCKRSDRALARAIERNFKVGRPW